MFNKLHKKSEDPLIIFLKKKKKTWILGSLHEFPQLIQWAVHLHKLLIN